VLTNVEKFNLRAGIAGEKEITPKTMLKLMSLHKMMRLRRHAVSLATIYSKLKYKPVVIPYNIFVQLQKLFLRVEIHWNKVRRSGAPQRKTFLSYSYMYFQLCHHLGHGHLAGEQFLLKSKERLQLLHKLYGRISKKCNLKADLKVFQTK